MRQTLRFLIGRFVLMLSILSVAVSGCDSNQDDRNQSVQSTSSLPKYSPPTTSSSRTFSEIAADLQSIQDRGMIIKNQTRLTEVPNSGIHFRYENGARGQSLMVEATGGGAGWLDYDLDGQPDLYLVQGGNPAAIDLADQPIDSLF